MERKELKELLVKVKENDFKVPEGIEPFPLALLMMDYIGDTDPELRDRLILSVIFKWATNNIFTEAQLYELLNISIDDEHLHYGLGETNDSVFTRTFSVEIVAICIYMHRQKNYLEKKDVKKALDRVIEYMDKDIDVRGYVEEKGWAHGAAHGADAIDEFVRCDEIDKKDLKRILDCIRNKVQINYYSYVNEEDERLITAVVAVLERGSIEEEKILNWIDDCIKYEKISKYPEDMIIGINVKNFLRSLYFRIIDKPEYNNISKKIKEVLKNTNQFL